MNNETKNAPVEVVGKKPMKTMAETIVETPVAKTLSNTLVEVPATMATITLEVALSVPPQNDVTHEEVIFSSTSPKFIY